PKVTGFYHPDARPGDWVITNLLGEEQVGQIYEMPLTFPKGEYIIRLVIENPDREVDETVFITRSYNEFKAWVGGPDGSDR
ncbi:MAG: hypothetical protein ABIQ02_13765, partial [Saprospiraceae bacterium]